MVRPGCLVSPVTYTSGEGRSLPLYLTERAAGPVDRYLDAGSLAFVVALSGCTTRALLLCDDMRLAWATCGELHRWTGRSRG